MACENKEFKVLRQSFMSALCQINSHFQYFKDSDLFKSIIIMKNDFILKLSAKYLNDVLTLFSNHNNNT